MKTHAEIIDALGGIRKLARALEHKSHTTVQGWYARNKIPVDHWQAVIAKSGSLNHPVTASDLVPPAARPRPTKPASAAA